MKPCLVSVNHVWQHSSIHTVTLLSSMLSTSLTSWRKWRQSKMRRRSSSPYSSTSGSLFRTKTTSFTCSLWTRTSSKLSLKRFAIDSSIWKTRNHLPLPITFFCLTTPTPRREGGHSASVSSSRPPNVWSKCLSCSCWIRAKITWGTLSPICLNWSLWSPMSSTDSLTPLVRGSNSGYSQVSKKIPASFRSHRSISISPPSAKHSTQKFRRIHPHS